MSNSIATEITSEEQWEAQPVGTLARVGFIEHDDNGNEVDEGKTMTILRVDGDITVTVGTYMLAGGRHWTDVWVWEQGVDVIDTTTIMAGTGTSAEDGATAAADIEDVVDAAIAGHKKFHDDLMEIPARNYMSIPTAELPPRSPAKAIVRALRDNGWAPSSTPNDH